MKKILHIISVLTIVGGLSGTCLAFMYKYAAPRIETNIKKETEAAVFKVFPDAKSYETMEKDGIVVFLAKDNKKKSIGYAFTVDGNGYQGNIKIMAGVSLDLSTVSGIEILESSETPGLGQEIASASFRKQFEGLKAIPKIICIKGDTPDAPNEIEAITGATISSNAVTGILNNQIAKIKKVLGG